MTEKMDLKEIERKVYLTYHKDGLVDICIGSTILTYVVALFIEILLAYEPFSFIPFLGGIPIMWVLMYTGAKKSITVPRIGYVEFSSKRHSKTVGILAGLVLLNVGFLFFSIVPWMYPEVGLLLERNAMILFGAFGGSIIIVLAYVTDLRRFYGYGIVTLVGFVLGHFFSIILLVPAFTLGIIMTVSGCVLLYRFIRRYPKVREGEDSDAPVEY